MTNSEYYGYTKEVHELTERLIEQDILANQSLLITEVLKQPKAIAGIHFDNIVNLYTPEDESKEVYEWWLVNQRLADELTALEEVLLFADADCYWGRCCTGQSIILDGTIQQIAQKLLLAIE